MALIVTLIMLSVTLVMALAFLAISRHESSSVTTQTGQQTAQLAAGSALAAAEAQLAANIISTTNPDNFSLLVSTNYINNAGFQTGPATSYTSLTNVSYDYPNGVPLFATAKKSYFLQMLANLSYAPRPPVFVLTNAATGARDFRYYLDLNRNGRDDPNGDQPQIGLNGGYLHPGGIEDNNPVDVLTNFMVGDPEWIGVLEHPGQPYGPDNPFLARYAFIALPVGNSLDLNFIHNQAMTHSVNYPNGSLPPGTGDGYFRNQGVGTWEMNLAAFLADLNTNAWDFPSAPYRYNEPFGFNSGVAFDDARALLSWRYNFYYNSLAPAQNLFGNGAFAFRNDGIDDYGDGPLQTTVDTNEDAVALSDIPNRPWPGADSTNRFFNLPSDLFDPAKSSVLFTNRLTSAGMFNSTYDRYTFYRMLAQIGTVSQAASGKMNLNYSNAVVTYTNQSGVFIPTGVAVVPGAETNLVSWNAQDFFIAAADRMLRAYTTNWFEAAPSNYLATYYGIIFTNYVAANGYGLTNIPFFGMTNQVPAFGLTGTLLQEKIPVLISNRFVYTSAVNRVLQLAANLYDASTNQTAVWGADFPSVFRPIFEHDRFGDVFIVGYTTLDSTYGPGTVTGTADRQLSAPVSVSEVPKLPSPGISGSEIPIQYPGGSLVNVYGVPWIIGVKKGFPAFDQLYALNNAQVTRKLEVTRTSRDPASAFYATNQMYLMGITNHIGIAFWNSYSNNYPRPLTVHASDVILTSLTNRVYPNGMPLGSPFVRGTNFTLQTTIRSWPGSQWGSGRIAPPDGRPNPASFQYVYWTFPSLPESIYRLSTGTFAPNITGQQWETGIPLWPLDHDGPLGLSATNYLQAYILDGNHVIDYVQLRGPIDSANVNQLLADPNYPDRTDKRYQWSTNSYKPSGPMTYGVYNQIVVSANPTLANGLNPNGWVRPPTMPATVGSTPEEESRFFTGFFFGSFQYNGKFYPNNELSVQVPYTPTRSVYDYTLWQANDPLVHYLGSDLTYVDPGTVGWHRSDDPITQPLPAMNPTTPGKRYQPWGLNTQMAGLGNVDTNAYNLMLKDPLVWSPDNWDFPTNKYPTVGWIGRVHRGTPWQTVYLKAPNQIKQFVPLEGGTTNYIGTNTWAEWTGDTRLSLGQFSDAADSAPVQDRLLFDLFTTGLNGNATRGRLSVNQTHLAAWSALLSGMVVLSNSLAAQYQPILSYATRPPTVWTNISPAGVDPQQSALWQIVTNINAIRTLYPQGTFAHAGDVLSASLLSDKSPFLNWDNLNEQRYGISDQMYEWLPQQMMSLVSAGSPRYVIYAYGQALQPAPNGIYLESGPYFRMVTNYQVTAETVVRAVVQFNTGRTNENTGAISVVPPRAVIQRYNVMPPD